MSGDVTTVQLAPGWAIWLGEVLLGPGDHVEVDPDTAEHWCSRRWTVPVDENTERKGG